MIVVTQDLSIEERDITIKAQRSSGPGGQHVNTSDTAILLQFNLYRAHLPEPVRQRLLQRSDQRIQQGMVRILCDSHRSQRRNREEAIQRLVALIKSAARPPRARKKTKPTYGSIQDRLKAKTRRSQTKRLRGKVSKETE